LHHQYLFALLEFCVFLSLLLATGSLVCGYYLCSQLPTNTLKTGKSQSKLTIVYPLHKGLRLDLTKCEYSCSTKLCVPDEISNNPLHNKRSKLNCLILTCFNRFCTVLLNNRPIILHSIATCFPTIGIIDVT
jgi:hypothetical protein